ncbi:hemin uptake protein HemP [Minwuia sp.]|uniref:hemin uptake protein HemP n=1 Tax=Minwuia sp. TaxID=2493630 RepID=UPI003A90E872
MPELPHAGSAASVPVAARPEGRVIESADLFREGREMLIRHRGEIYRLRLTGANKLILVK